MFDSRHRERVRHWRILYFKKKKISKSHFKFLLRKDALHMKWAHSHFGMMLRWRAKHWKYIKHIKNMYRIGRITHAGYIKKLRPVEKERHDFYQKRRVSEENEVMRMLTLDHKERMRRFKHNMIKKKWTLKTYRKNVRMWTKHYNWRMNITKKWLKIRLTFHDKFRAAHLVLEAGKINHKQLWARINRARHQFIVG